jgi:hypothetical protein
MRQHLQQLTRKLVILLLEALIIGALIAFAFFLKPSPTSRPPALQQPTTAPKAPEKPSLSQDNATTVLELFNPSDQSLTNQLNETTVRQQIEQIIATNYVLANCKRIDTDTYRNSFRALMVYAQKTKLAANSIEADAKVRQIAESANASYSLLYYRTKCDDPKLDTVTAQLIAWQESQLSK